MPGEPELGSRDAWCFRGLKLARPSGSGLHTAVSTSVELHQGEGIIMSAATAKYLLRDPAQVTPWAETCGQIRPLIEASDAAAAEVHQVEINHAKLHYHVQTDEIYYFIEGTGSMILDDEEIAVHPGVVMYVPRGVRHKAVGALKVLLVCIPPGVMNDIHELE